MYLRGLHSCCFASELGLLGVADFCTFSSGAAILDADNLRFDTFQKNFSNSGRNNHTFLKYLPLCNEMYISVELFYVCV